MGTLSLVEGLRSGNACAFCGYAAACIGLCSGEHLRFCGYAVACRRLTLPGFVPFGDKFGECLNVVYDDC